VKRAKTAAEFAPAIHAELPPMFRIAPIASKAFVGAALLVPSHMENQPV
jgi:hypothetical protein